MASHSSINMKTDHLSPQAVTAHQVKSIALSGAAELISAYEQNPVAIARQSALPEQALFRHDLTISGWALSDFLSNAARACQERFFGLKLGLGHGMQILGPIWLLMRSSETVGEALQTMAKHFQLHTDIAAVHLQREQDGVSLIYEMLDDRFRDESQLVEHGFALTVLELKALLGNRWQPQFVQFRYAAPYNLTPLRRVLGERLHFNQDHNALHLSAADLEHPLAAPDPERRKIIGRQLGLNLEANGQQLITRTEMALRALITEQACQLRNIASALGVSARTLQRQLREQGTGFQALYDKVRIDLAKKYLANTALSVAAIAERLHFSETAAFTRHFKRLAGITPRAFRQQHKTPNKHPTNKARSCEERATI